jgi:hypothetical protein
VIHITGRLRLRVSLSHGRTVPSQIMGLVVVAHALPPPTINEVRIDCHMFVTRVNMDLNIIYCENRYFVFVFIHPATLYTLVTVCVFDSRKDFTFPMRLITIPDLVFNGCLDWHQTCFLFKIYITALIYIRDNNWMDWDTQIICYKEGPFCLRTQGESRAETLRAKWCSKGISWYLRMTHFWLTRGPRMTVVSVPADIKLGENKWEFEACRGKRTQREFATLLNKTLSSWGFHSYKLRKDDSS